MAGAILKKYILANVIISCLRYWRILRVSMLRHFSISSWRITSGVFKETVLTDTMSVHGEDFIFCGGRDHHLALIQYLEYRVKIVSINAIYFKTYVILHFNV